MKPTKAEAEAWRKKLVDDAEQKILNLTDSDKFKEYLDTLAKFHQYSSRNVSLIYSQDPTASEVAGYKKWKTDFNRQVKKGAKSIRIAAPIIKKLTPEEQKRLNTTDERGIVGYRYIPVFDIKQTTGERLINVKDFVKEHLEEHKNVTALFDGVKDYLNKNTNLKVSEKPLAELEGAKGYFVPKTNEIVIGEDEPDSALKLKTLYHEYAHSQLHGLTSEFKNRSREYQETQAEAVAYVAMQNIGVDTSDYSLGYVATWAKDKDLIHSALNEIQKVSNKVIDLSDTLTEKLGLQQEQDITKVPVAELNKTYLKLQNDLQQTTNQAQKNQLKNQFNDVHQEISNRTQKQLKDFAKQNPEVKQSEKEDNILKI